MNIKLAIVVPCVLTSLISCSSSNSENMESVFDEGVVGLWDRPPTSPEYAEGDQYVELRDSGEILYINASETDNCYFIEAETLARSGGSKYITVGVPENMSVDTYFTLSGSILTISIPDFLDNDMDGDRDELVVSEVLTRASEFTQQDLNECIY